MGLTIAQQIRIVSKDGGSSVSHQHLAMKKLRIDPTKIIGGKNHAAGPNNPIAAGNMLPLNVIQNSIRSNKLNSNLCLIFRKHTMATKTPNRKAGHKWVANKSQTVTSLNFIR